MTYKNLGPDVSEKPTSVVAGGGQYTADDHSFESVVFQQDRPILDWEFNLLQEILGQAGSRLLALKTLPTCVLSGDFLEDPGLSTSYSFLTPSAGNESRFVMKAMDFIINGWPVRFEYSGSATPGENVVQLPAPPGGGNRTDLVILEVWRALVSPAPSILNKSPTGQILRHGNAKAADQFPPGNVNLADDLLDPDYVQETQKRVQIQYRYRVISGVDLGVANIDGFGTLLARSVPYQNASGVDGEAPLFPLQYASSPQSYGLWVAGAGNAADALALGSVDGFMYAVPLCAIIRRNSSAFNEASNRNGAPLIGALTNPRADGLYSDQIVEGDVLDLRHGTAWDVGEVLEKNFQFLLDNTLASHHELLIDGASTVGGTSFTVGDDIALVSQSAGQADGIRAHFSDRQVTEACIHRQVLAGATTVAIPLSAIVSPWGTTQNVVANGPAGTLFTGVTKVRITNGGQDYDMLDAGSPQQVLNVIVNAASVTVNFDGAVTGTLFVELLVTYPKNFGVRRNILQEYDLWTPPPATMAAWVDPLLFSVGDNPAGRYSITQSSSGSPVTGRYWWTDVAHRELTFNVPATSTVTAFNATAAGVVVIPERVSVALSNTAPFVVTSFTYDGAFTIVNFAPIPLADTAISLTYTPFRPPPFLTSGLDKYTLWYKTRAVQTVEPLAGTQTLKLIPRAISKGIHSIVSGSGGPDGSFPYDAPGAQIPITLQPAASNPEATMDSPNTVVLAGFGSDSGYVQVPVYIPYSPNPSMVTLHRDAVDDVMDGDGRTYWPRSDNGLVPAYSPSAFGQAFSSSARHKVVLPTICELKEDVPTLGVRGTLLLVVFARLSLTSDNNISITPVIGDSGAAVYRLKGGILSPRRTQP